MKRIPTRSSVVPLVALAVVACGPRSASDGGGGAGYGGRDQVRVVGSSTVYPFATRAAEQLGRTTAFKTPVVESTGTGGGFKLFCAGVGVDSPDVANASRAITAAEVENCRAHGVEDVAEIAIGFDGIVVANARRGPRLELSRRQLFSALAREVPQGEAAGKLVANPYRTWKDVDPTLPAVAIEVLGPPPTSGTRDAFVELVMEAGCREWGWLAALASSDRDRFKRICHAVREDGAYVEAGENDNLIVQKLAANPEALGVFGFSFLDENLDKLQGNPIDGVEPTFETIADGSYPVSRRLYVYVKREHVGVIPGLAEFAVELTSERAAGPDGYLAEIGLIPLPEEERRQARAVAASLAGGG